MSNTIIAEGKTSTEAIENGLKQLKVSKDMVEIKILEEENKKSFFSILTTRTVRVELKLKEKIKKQEIVKKEYNSNLEEIENTKKDVEKFIKEFIEKINKNIQYNIKIEDNTIFINMNG